MITCIKCGGFISHDSSNLSSICQECVDKQECIDKLVDKASPAELLALAKTGLDVVIDEVTDYQEVRPPKELSKRHKQYGGGE